MTSRTATAASIALVTGIAVRLLFAPMSGRDSRKRIAKKAVDAKDMLEYILLQAQEYLNIIRSTAKDVVDAIAEVAESTPSIGEKVGLSAYFAIHANSHMLVLRFVNVSRRWLHGTCASTYASAVILPSQA